MDINAALFYADFLTRIYTAFLDADFADGAEIYSHRAHGGHRDFSQTLISQIPQIF